MGTDERHFLGEYVQNQHHIDSLAVHNVIWVYVSITFIPEIYVQDI
jgi:hypothetical protein